MPLATVPTKLSVSAFLNSIENEKIKKDSKEIVKIMTKITGKKPVVWGTIIGFGKYKYKRKNSKEEFEWFHVGFAPRKDKLSFYLTCYLDKEAALLKKLGKNKHGKGCLHIKKLEDVDLEVLKKLISKYKDVQWFQ